MTSEDGRDLKAFERYHRTSSESSERKKQMYMKCYLKKELLKQETDALNNHLPSVWIKRQSVIHNPIREALEVRTCVCGLLLYISKQPDVY